MSDIPESMLRKLMPSIKIPSPEERERMDRENLELEKKREQESNWANIQRLEFERTLAQKAKKMFGDIVSLKDAIKKEILHSIVSIRTNYGVIGTGFFYHGDWLVSNAHVLPTREVIVGGGLQTKNGLIELKPIESFHRPHELHTSPDIVIVHDESVGFSKGLKQISRNHSKVSKHYFYAYYNHSTGEHEIRHIKKIKQNKEEFPLKFKPADDVEPQKGCSGAPIIEAFINTDGSEPKWVFQVIGVVYARCLSLDEDDIKLICGIPVDEEFDKILNILYSRSTSTRFSQMALAHKARGYPEDLEKIREYEEKTKEENEEILKKIKSIEAGATSLYITLPEGLEKLYGSDIIGLQYSLFLEEARNAIGLKKGYINTNTFPSHYKKANEECSLEFLKKEIREMIMNIRQEKEMQFTPGTPRIFRESPNKYFRIDIQGGKTRDYSLQLQDCLGYGQKLQGLSGNAKQYNGKPVSSTFAIVSWSKDKQADANLFADMLELSWATIEEIDLDFISKKKQQEKLKEPKKRQPTQKEMRAVEFRNEQIESELDEKDSFFEEIQNSNTNNLSAQQAFTLQSVEIALNESQSHSIPLGLEQGKGEFFSNQANALKNGSSENLATTASSSEKKITNSIQSSSYKIGLQDKKKGHSGK